MARCEDYPCCGHTDGLGCGWTSPNDDPTQYFCECGTFHRVGRTCPYHGDEYLRDRREFEEMYGYRR